MHLVLNLIVRTGHQNIMATKRKKKYRPLSDRQKKQLSKMLLQARGYARQQKLLGK
jgi:hypothetical protein